jgi:hypothetical protein
MNSEQELFTAICQGLTPTPYMIRTQCETVQDDYSSVQLPQAKFDVVATKPLDDDIKSLVEGTLISLHLKEDVTELVSTTNDTTLFSNLSEC